MWKRRGRGGKRKGREEEGEEEERRKGKRAGRGREEEGEREAKGGKRKGRKTRFYLQASKKDRMSCPGNKQYGAMCTVSIAFWEKNQGAGVYFAKRYSAHLNLSFRYENPHSLPWKPLRVRRAVAVESRGMGGGGQVALGQAVLTSVRSL